MEKDGKEGKKMEDKEKKGGKRTKNKPYIYVILYV